MRVELEPGFILHRRAYRETSLLLDVFSLRHGRISLVARGAAAARSPLKSLLQPFIPLHLSWMGRHELPLLVSAETTSIAQKGLGRQLLCGFYLNELLQRLLPAAEPVPELFAHYLASLTFLADCMDPEPGLRRFEDRLLAALGYGVSWDCLADESGRPEPSGVYGIDPDLGILSVPPPGCRLVGIPGECLLNMAADDFVSGDTRWQAKRIMRVLLDHRLNGRPLNSRALFIASRRSFSCT